MKKINSRGIYWERFNNENLNFLFINRPFRTSLMMTLLCKLSRKYIK